MTGEFAVLGAAAAGMDVQRAALDVAARNVAAAQVAGPHDRFARLVPIVVARGTDGDEPDAAIEARVDALDRAEAPFGSTADAGADADAPVRFAGTRVERGHDVDVVTEMVAVLDAQRAFDANASLFDAGKRLAERTIDAGRL
jgi:flagellar basal body rod protein FlgC